MNTPRQPDASSTSLIPRVISLIVLVGLVVLFGAMFYQVMAEFLVPLFLAMLLTVLASPLFNWLLPRCKKSPRLAALATVFVILAIILIPTVLLSIRAIREAENLLPDADAASTTEQAAKASAIAIAAKLPPSLAMSELANQPPHLNTLESQKFHDLTVQGVTWVNEHLGTSLNADEVQTTIVERAKTWLKDIAIKTPASVIKTPASVISFLFGLSIMLIAVYYFLIDGHSMIESVGQLLPLAGAHQKTLLRDFVDVSRAVAAATLLSALCQGLLAGIGYYFAGVPSVVLLTFITILASLVPFIGAAIIWIPACLWLYWFKDGGTFPAILLAVYCIAVVSMVDNLVKPLVLQGKTNLHPLLALLSVLGGVQALGAIGLFVGPMAVVFLQAALTMLRDELQQEVLAK
jgi:predicted PurR-regulated permease PerM